MTDALTGGRPGRVARIADTTALLLILAGAAVYLYAANGMHALATHRLVHPEGNLMTNEWIRFVRLEHAARYTIIAGLAAGLLSFTSYAWIGRRRGA
jgi:hypothetical protein